MHVDLTMLGKSIERLQQEVREVRAEQTSLRAEIAGLRAHFTAHLTGLQAALEATIDTRLVAFSVAMHERFETTHQQMATNLEAVLAEIRKLRRE